MQDITDRLDAELRTPPPPTFDVRATVGAGRCAVRRQRLVRGGAALALALVLGGAGVAVTSQVGDSRGPAREQVQVAAGVSSAGLAPTDNLVDGFPAGYDPQHDDVVLVRDGWEVVERIDQPVTGLYASGQQVAIRDSVALDLRKGGEVRWVILYRMPAVDEGNGSHSQPGGGIAGPDDGTDSPDLASWLADQKDLSFSSKAAG
ncbi:hypothetical protein [Nocardioides daeguensis]|uniref:Uncharacterized protein n=1 Tax=Nocardioides daeguensis TaxID=908359 RepID=A0ABP6V6D9_9ACTN|nr:hypothetical protein [Nocardioides daeguensis]MBV6726299.1 hypothetical protein [Nocardioides daeguensis]MCR1772142.1 hypothetical protein [Nocardioides daeguensis]